MFGSYDGENTPEVFKKSRVFLDPSTGSGHGRVPGFKDSSKNGMTTG
jgi:hypothetical protein